MLNNPLDSVSDYLAELLYEGDTGDKVSAIETAPVKPAAKEVRPEAPLSPTLEVPAIDREKLSRLLRSAPLAQPLVRPAAPEAIPLAPAAPDVAQVVPTSEATLQPVSVSEPEPLQAWCENGRPTWAQARFDVLLFKVYGLTLAVPLIALGQIQPLTDDLTPLFGQADWFMGIQPTPTGKIKTVNTALFVMPERYDAAFLESARYVISIDGLDWGLAVDSVEQPISLDPDAVKWRSGRGQRPWLAGTIKDHMCALLDIPNMGRILRQADRNR